MEARAMKECLLFRGLSAAQLERALAFFSGTRKAYEKGDFLNRIGVPLESFGLVLSGSVHVYMDDIDGHHMIMANVTAGETFGESLCFLGLDASVYICAVADTEVLWLHPERLKSAGALDAFERGLFDRFTTMLAQRTLAMNDRIQILSKTSIRAKLITFFSQYVQRFGNPFTIPFDRSSMAVYLGTDRSALSRELSKLKQEGVIDFKKNRFRVRKGMEME